MWQRVGAPHVCQRTQTCPRVLEVLLRRDRTVQSTYLSGVDGVEDVGHSTEDSVLDKLLAFHLHGHVNS